MSRRRKPNSGNPRGLSTPGRRVPVRLTLDFGDGPSEVVVTAQYEIVGGHTRLSDLRDAQDRVVVDLPDDVRFQLPRDVVVVGRLLVDDHVRIRSVSRVHGAG